MRPTGNHGRRSVTHASVISTSPLNRSSNWNWRAAIQFAHWSSSLHDKKGELSGRLPVASAKQPLRREAASPRSRLSQCDVRPSKADIACGFKAALPRERLRFCAILSNVAVRSYDGALRFVYGCCDWRGEGLYASDSKKCITCFHHLCRPYRNFGKPQRTILSGTTCAVRVQSGVRSTKCGSS